MRKVVTIRAWIGAGKSARPAGFSFAPASQSRHANIKKVLIF
jgi:hypothetical protein